MDTLQGSWPRSGSPVIPADTRARPESAPRRALGALGFFADTIRRRRSGRLVLWGLVAALASSGGWLVVKPIVTDVWASRIQDGLETEFAALEDEPAPPVEQVADGRPITRLVINKIGLRMIVVSGVSGNALRAGAGHFPESALPGSQTGNVAIAGHRTGFGDPFRHLDRLTQGDRIVLETPRGRFVYEVSDPPPGIAVNPFVVAPTATWVKQGERSVEPILTLITCDPPGTTKNRLIVQAKLVRSA